MKNATPAAAHWSRRLRAQSGCIGRAFGTGFHVAPVHSIFVEALISISLLRLRVAVVEAASLPLDEPHLSVIRQSSEDGIESFGGWQAGMHAI